MIARVLLAGSILLAGCGSGARIEPARGETSGTCTAVRTTDDEGADHLDPGQTADYDEDPPASGPHDGVPLRGGVYRKTLTRHPAGSQSPTIFRLVHSLEHGYVVVYHKPGDVDGDDLPALRAFGRERKVIVVPGTDDMNAVVVLVAWRRVQECSRADARAVASFIARFREKTAPEPGAA